MRAIPASATWVTPPPPSLVYKHLEWCGRKCYKSTAKEDSAEKFLRGLIKSGHESVLEHYSLTALFVCDRGVSHELVRHRLSSFSQESTRYCNYGHEQEITVIEPLFWSPHSEEYKRWWAACAKCEEEYMHLTNKGGLQRPAQEARDVLPNSLKTEVVMTSNIRQWRTVFKQRAAGLTGKPHPQMLEVAVPLLRDAQQLYPALFDDITPMEVPTYEKA